MPRYGLPNGSDILSLVADPPRKKVLEPDRYVPPKHDEPWSRSQYLSALPSTFDGVFADTARVAASLALGRLLGKVGRGSGVSPYRGSV